MCLREHTILPFAAILTPVLGACQTSPVYQRAINEVAPHPMTGEGERDSAVEQYDATVTAGITKYTVLHTLH